MKKENTNKEITDEKLNKYLKITGKALEKASKAINLKELEKAKDFLDMASRYYDDAEFFKKQGKYVLAYGAINYAHGWLDAGARIGLFKVRDSVLFTVDENDAWIRTTTNLPKQIKQKRKTKKATKKTKQKNNKKKIRKKTKKRNEKRKKNKKKEMKREKKTKKNKKNTTKDYKNN